MTLFSKHRALLDLAVQALHDRSYFAAYAESPKHYPEDAAAQAATAFESMKGKRFALRQLEGSAWHGEEVSPFTQQPLGISYPLYEAGELVRHVQQASAAWRRAGVEQRVGVLLEALEYVKEKFFELAIATQHTSGQSWLMSFQASGPHAADRALETIAMGYLLQTQFAHEAWWEKQVGKATVRLHKTFRPVGRGVALVIGCSTFPVWNSFPGIFASLVTGNGVIVKPHPGAVLPIAIATAAIQRALSDNGFDAATLMLTGDRSAMPVARDLALHEQVAIIDYTGSSAFGNWLESLAGKVVFTEKAGVNAVILDSVSNLDAVVQNLAFSLSLYSGQMCTAPQNIFIPRWVGCGSERLSRQHVTDALQAALEQLMGNPKSAAGVLGALQNARTRQRVHEVAAAAGKPLTPAINEEFPDASLVKPVLLEVQAGSSPLYHEELFGPVAVVVQTEDTSQAVEEAARLAKEKGAITCLVYSTDDNLCRQITDRMNELFVPVSFNLTGPIWVNQHAAFSDLHGTGANAAGTACFTDAAFVARRFVWVGNRTCIS
ncbi:MAG: phenylacetic acid degradation protein PaaN [Chitinophagales bacterium]|nr:phenylacetic acid degradation protein PaaN [Chitinophagales bacterium]MDW8394323.1 phenylacetic acid degradation protein PaaN [Chitinophagales bacterium]